MGVGLQPLAGVLSIRLVEVSFRFYGRLNDFLPARRRAVRFAYRLAAPASVKDTIEALGIPHPEVDLIIVNGSSCSFSARVQDGDRVAVYPAFQSIVIDPDQRVGVDRPRPARFALDVHLQKLASRLRLAGFDAIVIADDADLAEAGGERIVLTRDVALLKRNAVRCGHWVRRIDPDAQLAEILQRFDLTSEMEPFARCLRCNTPVVPVEREAVEAQVPPRTRACVHEYHWCPHCEQVYWRGSHYPRLAELVARAAARAARQTH
jgi:hypothetical protein